MYTQGALPSSPYPHLLYPLSSTLSPLPSLSYALPRSLLHYSPHPPLTLSPLLSLTPPVISQCWVKDCGGTPQPDKWFPRV